MTRIPPTMESVGQDQGASRVTNDHLCGARPSDDAGQEGSVCDPASRRAYATLEPHLSGFRVTVGFETRDDAWAFYEKVAKS